MALRVNVDTFVRAETDRMFHDLQRDAGGVNRFRHNREPAPINEQTVIRLNRDTLYSFGVVNVSRGATLTLPDAGSRYRSAMIVNRDHYVTGVHHDPGEVALDAASAGSEFVLIAVRTLVDPTDPADLAAVAALQDTTAITAGADDQFRPADWDPASLDATRAPLLQLAAGLTGYDRMFGARDEVDPVRHLIGTAAGWGGLPTSEAAYAGGEPANPSSDHVLVLRDVPVDAFWSISVYNAEGYFEPNPHNRYTVNSVTATPDPDGAVTVRFVHGDPAEPNSIPVPANWNYLVRLYRPRPEILDRTWTLPQPAPAQ